MKRTRFDGHDKKIIELLAQHKTLSAVEMANYLNCSRNFIIRICKGLIKEGKIKGEIIKNSEHSKYFPQTVIYAINKDYSAVKSFSDTVSPCVNEIENNSSEYLTKESAKLLFNHLVAVIENHENEIQQIKINQGKIELDTNYYISQAKQEIIRVKEKIKSCVIETQNQNSLLITVDWINDAIESISKLYNN
jgi:DNA-binding Lrp family transcriptional regulator